MKGLVFFSYYLKILIWTLPLRIWFQCTCTCFCIKCVNCFSVVFLIDWLIDWGLTPFLTISQLYHGGQFTYLCISWFSHTSTPHNNLPKQLAAFTHRLSPLVKDEWRMSHWPLSIVRKKVGRAGIQTHNLWIDSPRLYWLSYPFLLNSLC